MRVATGLCLALAAVLLVTAGCLTDEVTETEPGDEAPGEGDPSDGPGDGRDAPVRPPGVPDPVEGLSFLGQVEAESGLGVETRGGTAYVASPSGLYTVDLSNASAPETLAVARDAPSRYVDLMVTPTRLVAAASGAQQEQLHFVDVTDPEQPELMASLAPNRTVHNVAHVPGTSLFYNPRGVGDPVEPGIDIIDASDPTNPEVVERWPLPATAGAQPTRSTGCAVVTFDVVNERGFCPGVDQTYVLDVANQTQPEVVSAITNPAINVHHWTATLDGGSTLAIADWAAAANAPTCGRAGPLSETAGPPAGAVWLYNLSDPEDPTPEGWVALEAPDELGPDEPCSPHVIESVPGRDALVAGWHAGGVVLVGAEDPANPTVRDRWTGGSDAWAVDVHGGWVTAGLRGEGAALLELSGG